MRKNNTYCYLPSFQFVSVTSFTFSLATRHSVAYLGGLRGFRGTKGLYPLSWYQEIQNIGCIVTIHWNTINSIISTPALQIRV